VVAVLLVVLPATIRVLLGLILYLALLLLLAVAAVALTNWLVAMEVPVVVEEMEMALMHRVGQEIRHQLLQAKVTMVDLVMERHLLAVLAVVEVQVLLVKMVTLLEQNMAAVEVMEPHHQFLVLP
jgi:hypothetical protein